MTLKEIIQDVEISKGMSDKIEQIADDYALKFHNWMRKEDTPENAEKYFGYTDKDMLNVFKEGAYNEI
jgi:hypothetical protein